MSNSQFDEPQNIVVNDGGKNKVPIDMISRVPAVKNISGTSVNSITNKQIAAFGGNNITIIINNQIGDKNSDSSSSGTDATSGAIEYYPSDGRDVREELWSVSNPHLQRWINLSFSTAKREYDFVFKSLFLTVFNN